MTAPRDCILLTELGGELVNARLPHEEQIRIVLIAASPHFKQYWVAIKFLDIHQPKFTATEGELPNGDSRQVPNGR